MSNPTYQCAGCGRHLPSGSLVVGTETPGLLVTLCRSPCGDRAVADDIFAGQCVAARAAGTTRAHLETIYKKTGFALPTCEADVRAIFGTMARGYEADTGQPAPTFEAVMASVNLGTTR